MLSNNVYIHTCNTPLQRTHTRATTLTNTSHVSITHVNTSNIAPYSHVRIARVVHRTTHMHIMPCVHYTTFTHTSTSCTIWCMCTTHTSLHCHVRDEPYSPPKVKVSTESWTLWIAHMRLSCEKGSVTKNTEMDWPPNNMCIHEYNSTS